MKHTSPYILMLEDDEDDRYITQKFFTDKGYSIGLEFLTDADAVLPYLEHCVKDDLLLPRVVLLDKKLPSGNGLEVLTQLKSHPVFRIIPVVMISGSDFHKDIAESYRIGVNSFIVKPFKAEETEKAIDAFVNYWFSVVSLPEVIGVE